MSFDPSLLFASLFPSGIGLVLFLYGRKEQRLPQLLGGLALMIYPYFTDTLPGLCFVGLAIGLAVWLAVRAGW